MHDGQLGDFYTQLALLKSVHIRLMNFYFVNKISMSLLRKPFPKSHLFHRQAESFVTQAIKDTLPYFLGAVNGRALELEAERKEKRREYTRISRALADTKEISGRSTTRGASLLSEAVSVGLASDTEVDQTDFNALFDYLKGLQMVTAPVPASHLDNILLIVVK